nr:hypothetical protein [uncultured Treponema sp.]
MKQGKPLSAERISEIAAHEIDLSDIPELTKEQWEKGHFKNQVAVGAPQRMPRYRRSMICATAQKEEDEHCNISKLCKRNN